MVWLKARRERERSPFGLLQADDDDKEPFLGRQMVPTKIPWLSRLRHGRLALILSSLVVFIATWCFLSTFRQGFITQEGAIIHDDLTLDAASIAPGQRKLVILLPVDRPSHDLCKVISSAVALGYPAPVLVNWRKDFHTDEVGIGPSHLGKIWGTQEFLDWAMSDDAPEEDRLGEDDLIIMMDALDIWFQLPPEVMLERYFRITQDATRRLVRRAGYYDPDWMNQTVIIAAQKGCQGPRDYTSNFHCKDVPESPLPRDLYGMWTDWPLWGWSWLRPGWVNSGGFMGPAGDLGRYFARVKSTVARNTQLLPPGQTIDGDQGVFSQVFGEQEVWRSRLLGYRAKDDKGSVKDSELMRDEFSYHLTLDYTQELFYPTGYAAHDAKFVVLNKESTSPRRVTITSDMVDVRNPLADLEDVAEDELSWDKMSIFVDTWTTSIPATMHHNEWRGGLKARRTTWWNLPWFFPHLRRLLEANSNPSAATGPLKSFEANNGTLDVWPYDRLRPHRSALILNATDEGGWTLDPADWETVCKSDDEKEEKKKHWYQEVLRDGKGPL